MTLLDFRIGRYTDTRSRHDMRERISGAKRSHGKKGKEPTLWQRGLFLAFDGEGLTTKTRHEYVMLCCSNGESITNVAGLDSVSCLEFLCAQSERYNRRAICVAYGASYDVNMIVRDFSLSQLTRLWAGEWVMFVNRFTVKYTHRKCFQIRRVRDSRSACVLWDVIGFFQAPFIHAIAEYLGEGYDGLRFVAVQKRRRSRFAKADFDGMLTYCLLECRMLVDLMEKLREHLATANLPVSRWDGAGAVAASLLRREGIKNYMSVPALVPQAVSDAAQYAYAGGRIEALRFGHAPHTSIHAYDVRSAYPAAMQYAPCLRHGHWQPYRAYSEDTLGGSCFGLFHVRWKLRATTRLAPFFWRDTDHAIFFPIEGEGWYHAPEVQAALHALDAKQLHGSIDILDSYVWRQSCDHQPFAFIPPLYAQRAQWKRDGIGAQMALKLAINSLYGKTAQRIGYKKGVRPAFHELLWAGYVTSATRAKLFTAAIPHARDIIMLATDGVYSLAPLNVTESSELGGWEYEQYTGMTLVQSGVYWLDSPKYEKGKLFCRGFDRDAIARETVVDGWRKNAATAKIKMTRFVGMGSATNGRPELWRQWRTTMHDLSLLPTDTKRVAEPNAKPVRGLAGTYPTYPFRVACGDWWSEPYALPFEQDAAPSSFHIEGINEIEFMRETEDSQT
jgi:hypothetical protein